MNGSRCCIAAPLGTVLRWGLGASEKVQFACFSHPAPPTFLGASASAGALNTPPPTSAGLGSRLKPGNESGNKRYDVMDTDVRGFGVRVSEKGQRTFILLARYPGSTNPTRRALGEYPTLSLEKARVKARRWREFIAEGKDPRDEEEKARRVEQRRRADSFEAVVEEYAKRVLPKQRRGHIVAKELRTFFVEPWRGRPVTSSGAT